MRSRTRRLAAVTGAVPLALAAVAAAAVNPTVSTGGTEAVGETAATLKGSVNPQGSSTSYYFQVGLTTAYQAATTAQSAGSGVKTRSVSASIGGLTPATVYHYRIVATNRLGGAEGVDRTFKTGGHPLPTPVTGAAGVVNATTAIVSGTVGTQGEATQYAFQYGTTTTYGSQTFGGSVPPNTSPVGVQETLRGLAPGTTFHYRLVTLHAGLPATYGADATFITFPSPRVVPRLKVSTAPRVAARRPYAFRTAGILLVPSQLAGVACTGEVAVRFVAGRRVVAARRLAVLPNCQFAVDVRFRGLIGRRARTLRIEARFLGNNYLSPVNAPARRVRLGR